MENINNCMDLIDEVLKKHTIDKQLEFYGFCMEKAIEKEEMELTKIFHEKYADALRRKDFLEKFAY